MSPEQQYFANKIEELARRLESAEARVDRLTARLAVFSSPYPATAYPATAYPATVSQPEPSRHGPSQPEPSQPEPSQHESRQHELPRHPLVLSRPEFPDSSRPLSPVREWTGSEATALRKALRMTESRFASVLSVSLRTVAHWASNPATVPRASAQDMLDELLAAASPAVKAKFELVRLTA